MKTKRTIRIAVFVALTSLTASICSCDNPQTMAWLHYYMAKDTLEAGDPYAAQDYLKRENYGNPRFDSILVRKADSLRLVIEKAIEEDKNKATNDSI